MRHIVGKTVASIEYDDVQICTYDKHTVKSIRAIVFTDGSRVSFSASEVEHGDPCPRATYRARPK